MTQLQSSSIILAVSLSTDRLINPHPQAMYSSAYPQGSSVFQNNIPNHHGGNINECPNCLQKAAGPFWYTCKHRNSRVTGCNNVQRVASRLTNNEILVIRKYVKAKQEWYFEVETEKQTKVLVKYYIPVVLQFYISKGTDLHAFKLIKYWEYIIL